MKGTPKNIPSPYKFKGTKIFRDTTALPFADGGPLHDRNINGKLLQSTYASQLGNMFREGGPFGENKGAFDYATSVYASELGNYYRKGGMIKRADGSYSQRGLWDNIRANAGSGKKPTKEMLAQEKKINREYRTGGQFPTPYSLPEDSFKQGGRNLHNSIYASSSAQYPAIYRNGGMTSHFYASNVPDNNISNKDLTYPENSYVYALGGDLNNNAMNKYPDASNQLRNGSGIHINPANKGKFTETKKRTGKSTEELTHSKNPLTRKRAIFAQNAAKWHHQYGGNLFAEGGSIHINPANKGKFTASANAAGMGVQEFAHHVLANKEDYSTTQVKRANFARNAAGWHHENGGHIMAAGGWPPGLKLKNPMLSLVPYYTNAMTGLTAPSVEAGLEGQLGKQKGGMGWSVNPHIGVGYNPNGNFPLSGGIDTRYKGLKSPSGKGYATVDIGAGYTPEQGLGAGWNAGYNFRVLGQSNKRLGEIPAGKASLDLMPYAGWQAFQTKSKPIDYSGVENISTGQQADYIKSHSNQETFWNQGPIYGLRGEAQWRPKLFPKGTYKAPITFFGKGNFNLNPVLGKEEEKPSTTETYFAGVDPATGQPIQTSTEATTSNLKFKPQYSFLVGARMPLSRFEEMLPKRRIPAVEGGAMYEETPNPGDFTFDQRAPELNAKENAIPGQYEEEIGDLNKRVKQWGNTNIINPRFNPDANARMENANFDFQKVDYTQPLYNEDEDYKYGGTMKFKYGGFNNPGFNALPKNVQAKIKARTFDNGGIMPQLTEFNEGGRHEENVLGGIPQGTAADGRINLVEQGETKLNAANYIFSDTLKLDKGIAAAFNLPKSDIGKTFAEISKRLNRPNSRRDNDTIEQNAKQRDLENLMLAQEGFKQIDLQKDMEMMERKHPEMMQALQQVMEQQASPQPSPEEIQQGQPQGQPQMSPEEQQMMMQQQAQMDPAMMEQMAAQQGGVPQEQMGQIPMSYGGSMFACGGRMYPDGGGLGVPQWTTQYNPNALNLANPRYMYPTDAVNEPVYGSRQEAKQAMFAPGADISRTYYQDKETGKMGQFLSNAAMGDIKQGEVHSWSPNPSTKIAAEDRFNMGDYYYKHDATPYSGPYGTEPGLEYMNSTQYMNGGRMMRGGGEQFLRSVGAGAYGVGEGMLDTLTFGLTDSLTDKGYNALANIGNRDAQDLERDKMIRGFGNTAGAIGGAAVSGGAATGSAISQGAKGLGAGLTNIKGTNEEFDKTVNSLAQVGSMVGGLVGGNPASAAGEATKIPQFAQTMMKASQNPFLQQVTGMAGNMIQRNGGHIYPTIYPMYKDNAGPMGQNLTNLYKYGGSFENPRQQMYMPLDGVERTGGYLFAGGGPLDGIDPTAIQQGVSYVTDYLNNPEAAIKMGFDPKLVKEWTDPNTGEYEVPPGYRLEGPMKNFVSGLAGNPNMMEAAAQSAQNSFRGGEPLERMNYLPAGTISRTTPSFRGMPTNFINPTGDEEITEETDVVVDPNKRININGKLYTRDEALKAAQRNEIMIEPEDIDEYFTESIKGNNNNNVVENEEDLDEEIYPGMSNENIITGGKGDYSDTDLTDEILIAEQMVKNAKNPKDKAEAEGYLSALKRAQMQLEDKNVNLGMKQTLPQALGLAAPVAYNIGMGLFSKPLKFKEEDFMNKSKVSPYKVNVYPQLNEANLAYNSAERALKDMSPGAGAYLTNRSNLANNRAKAISSVLANKENVDAQLQMQADLQNAQINAQNKGNALAVQQLNAQALAAKQNMLGKGLEQLAQIAAGSQGMDAQEKYMRLISPQYGKTFEYKTIFDQAADALKNYRKNKSSNKEEK